MNSKLTLLLNDSVINEIKKYAKKSHVSLSHLVEIYFQTLISEKSPHKIKTIPPLTKSITGIVKIKSTKPYKQLLKEALTKNV
ncbi:MAG: DUF6364 family protein [Candidatus Margulisiibacteriota bacterium]|jgi:hypothetical protein